MKPGSKVKKSFTRFQYLAFKLILNLRLELPNFQKPLFTLVMGLFKRLRDWESRYALTFMGFVAGIIGIVFAAYTYFQKTNPGLRMEVVSNVKVVDIKEDVGKLEVLYEGVNLHSNKQTLSVATLKISNDGAAAISINAYDNAAPVGVTVAFNDEPSKSNPVINMAQGTNVQHVAYEHVVFPEITQAQLISASTEYLEKHTKLDFSKNGVTFQPVIFEPGDFLLIKLLILHGEGGSFEFTPTGKIAGVRSISFVGLNAKETPPSFWKQVFTGGILVQITRTASYFFIFLSGLLLIIIPIVSIPEFFEKKKRKRKIDEFKLGAKAPLLPEYAWVFNDYIQDGNLTLFRILPLLENPEKLAEGELLKTATHQAFFGAGPNDPLARNTVARRLLESKMVVKKGDNYVIDKGFQDFIQEFTRFVMGSITLKEMQKFYLTPRGEEFRFPLD